MIGGVVFIFYLDFYFYIIFLGLHIDGAKVKIKAKIKVLQHTLKIIELFKNEYLTSTQTPYSSFLFVFYGHDI